MKIKELKKIFKINIMLSSSIGLIEIFVLGDLWFFATGMFGPILVSLYGLYVLDTKIGDKK